MRVAMYLAASVCFILSSIAWIQLRSYTLKAPRVIATVGGLVLTLVGIGFTWLGMVTPDS